jgi:predicted DsbA family dithiol-disulfide isomerase
VEVVWHSFELRPEGSPPMPEAYRQRIEAGRPRLEAIAREYYGLTLNPGPTGISSRRALTGAKYAERQGAGDAYHEAAFRAYWQEARSIDDVNVLREIAASAGLDADAFAAALDDPAYDAEVQADVMQAYRMGISGVPALVFERKYLVSGAQPYDVLRQVVEQIESGDVAGSAR